METASTHRHVNKKCPKCKLVNFGYAEICARCGHALSGVQITAVRSLSARILRRAMICILVCVFTVLGFYASLLITSDRLSAQDRVRIDAAITIIENAGFTEEAKMLKRYTSFRSSDSWLNASIAKENAYAATNFPFEIVTIYPDFFSYTKDDVERAAILLHEAKHLQGDDEKAAYEFVWRNKAKIGWTRDAYAKSVVFDNVRRQTAEIVPSLFTCDFNPHKDCTQ